VISAPELPTAGRVALIGPVFRGSGLGSRNSFLFGVVLVGGIVGLCFAAPWLPIPDPTRCQFDAVLQPRQRPLVRHRWLGRTCSPGPQRRSDDLVLGFVTRMSLSSSGSPSVPWPVLPRRTRDLIVRLVDR
jgi:hypothetical protein